MSLKTPLLLAFAFVFCLMSKVRAQAFSDFANIGPIAIENNSITYAPGTTAVNVWDGEFAVDANGIVSGSGTLSGFANKQNRSTKTPFTILNGSRASSIQTSTQTFTNNSGVNGADIWFTTTTKTTTTADFNATAQIGTGKRPPTAQFKGIITAENTITSTTTIGPIVTWYNNGTSTTNGYFTNNEASTYYYTTIKGGIFGPSAQAGYFSAFANTNSQTNNY
jgi:hypothetical protein